ncbi:vgr related protein [Sphingomonas bacterium]|uniref:vgr related protein n=1 Tax=Sphingomonas bacterium TaxID=1895847 RepID=UPI0020C6F65B|nr:vgr related protein [Sphingomonas bacterium]
MDQRRESRGLTTGERALAAAMFGAALDPDPVEIRRWRWWPLQGREWVMAPRGHLHFHPEGTAYSPDFARESVPMQAFFLHELTHVWQYQRGVSLVLRRHPFCRYRYRLEPGRAFADYGIEQQGEIVRHAHLLRHGLAVPGQPSSSAYEALLAEAFAEPLRAGYGSAWGNGFRRLGAGLRGMRD